MSFDAETMYRLLPAIHRIRDSEQGEPLRHVLAVIAEQVAVLEENLEQLYDDQFIETCADWVTSYIGTLIGYRALHGAVPTISSPRAEVANTVAVRRRKGTAAMLEQLARDVTGWPARVVEAFAHLTTTQYLNHVRPRHASTPDLRRWEPLERHGSAFDPLAHSIDTRSITGGAGRHNIPNVGVFLWRLAPYRLAESPAVRVDDRRFFFSPLGNDTPLFTRHVSEPRVTHLAEPMNVPEPIRRRVLAARLEDYWGPGRSLLVRVDGDDVPAGDIEVCDLSDDGSGGWGRGSPTRIAVDPVLGRLRFPEDLDPDAVVLVTFHYGFSADLGGGAYERAATFTALTSGQALLRVPDDFPTVQAALDGLPAAGGVVEIGDNGRYQEALSITVGADASVELRAANQRRPTLVLTGDLAITGGDGGAVALDGLLVAGGALTVPDTGDNALRRLTVRHCTLVPGHGLRADGAPQQPGAVSLRCEITGLTLAVEHAIVGALAVTNGSETRVIDAIVDATDPTLTAYAGLAEGAEPPPAGGGLALTDTTVIGKVHPDRFGVVTNSLLFAALGEADDWPAPVRVRRKQEGCLRFSYVPPGSVVPREFRCQPRLAADQEIARRERDAGGPIAAAERARIRARQANRTVPRFTTRRYGRPGYGQLLASTPAELRTGAEDESEMGAFHKLHQPQRETNLRVRFDEYLRFGLEAGIFYET